MAAIPETNDHPIIITRVFDAPRELVFQAWTEAEHLLRWWAPKTWTPTSCHVDLRPGGSFRYCMRAPDGLEICGLGLYREIVALERIVYTDMFADADGNPVPPTHYGASPEYPAETLVTIVFEEQGAGTKVTLRQGVPPEIKERDGMVQGWNEMLDHLDEQLPKHPNDLTITRLFDAPPAMVFKAWTDPQLVARWWGPQHFTNPRCEVDARPGGAIRIDMRGPDGTVYPMTGVFHEVVEPVRLVFTSTALDGALEVRNTVTFAAENGKTRLTMHAAVIKAAPEAAVALSGMEAGWTQSLEKLGAIL